MPPVFGRDIPTTHPYDIPLSEWLESPVGGLRAMARNIMHDHRVSPKRELAFDEVSSEPRSASALQRAIVNYFETYIRTRQLPHYVYQDLNSNNLLMGDTSGSHVIHKDLQLVRVVDLNGLSVVFRWANTQGDRQFQTYPWSRDDSEVIKWLDARLLGKPESQVRKFIGSVLEVMNAYRAVQSFQPTWATSWAAFEPEVPKGPERWICALGVYKPVAPRWLMLLKYTAREAGTIARPTQLDAGWYSYHFPSPPQAPISLGGHPVDLQIVPRQRSLLPEFIHKQITHPLEHWLGSGRALARTTKPTGLNVTAERHAHLELLASIYGDLVFRWMPMSS
jgi:hypothetical protein